MRALLFCALLLVCGANAGDKMMREVKKWAKLKAMESCLGEEVVKMHLIKMKKAASKCTGIPAPELDLPMFNNPYKLVTHLIRGGGGSTRAGNLQEMMRSFLRLQMLEQFSDSPRSFDKRDADDDANELGERLTEKLKGKKEEWENKMGNMTCILQECGILDGAKKFNPKKAKLDWKDMPIKDKWVKDELEWACDQCEKMANNIPKPFLEKSPFGTEMCKVKMFKECMMKVKFFTCMKSDIRKKLEKHFGDVGELAKSTDLTEDQLLMVVKTLLKGPEEEFM